MPSPVWNDFCVDCYVVLANGDVQGCLEIRAENAKEQRLLEQLFREAESEGLYDPSRMYLDYKALDGYLFWSDNVIGLIDSDDFPDGINGIFKQNTFYLHPVDGQRRGADLDKSYCICQGVKSCLICRLQKSVKMAEEKSYRAAERTLKYIEACDYLLSFSQARKVKKGRLGHDQGHPDSQNDDGGGVQRERSNNESSGGHVSGPRKRGRGGKTRPGQVEKRKREEEAEVIVVVDEDVISEDVADKEVDDDEDFEPPPKRQKFTARDLGRSLLPKKAKATTRVARSAPVEAIKAVKVAKGRQTNNSLGSFLDGDPNIAIPALAPAPTTATEDVGNAKKKAQPWSNEERQALITLVAAHRNLPRGSEQETLYDVRLFRMISNQLEQQYGFKRNPGGCKNEYNRRGRSEGQVENRRVPNANRMATSMQ